MKLLVQGDDFGMTYGITDGICLAAEKGILTCTGLMTNFEELSLYAANRIKHYPHISVGIDINFFAGRPVTAPDLIPNLIDEKGYFRTSEELKKTYNLSKDDPFPPDETLIEVENQVLKFVELMGKYPDYIQGHSYLTPSLVKAILHVAQKYNIVYTLDKWKTMKMYNCSWLGKDNFYYDTQITIDVEKGVYNQLEELNKFDTCFIICHPGYLDNDLYTKSTYTAIRFKDLEMLTSKRIKEKLNSMGVQLINYQKL